MTTHRHLLFLLIPIYFSSSTLVTTTRPSHKSFFRLAYKFLLAPFHVWVRYGIGLMKAGGRSELENR